MSKQFDIIGDIHGHADELKALVSDMGYTQHGRGYRHADRKVVFVGDFVDRGPAIGEVLEIARAMVDAGDALAVIGNHEYNAIAFHTPRPGKRDEWFRPHSDKNLKQHHATLDQLLPGELADAIAWFRTLPVAIDIGGVRVAHASWQTRNIDCINDALADALASRMWNCFTRTVASLRLVHGKPEPMADRINVLFVGSRNQWRSPTAEAIYRDDPRVSVRSRGTLVGAWRLATIPPEGCHARKGFMFRPPKTVSIYEGSE